MKPLLLLSLLAIASLYACSPTPDPVLPPVNEYLVIGNDKGFRNDYIDQGNLVTVYDSSLTVRSLRSVESYRDYPIVNGYVEGGADPKLQWRMTAVGQDSIALTDTSRQNTFYLLRLNRVDSLPGVLDLLTSGEVKRVLESDDMGFRNNYVFNHMGQAAGGVTDRRYLPHRDWRKVTGNADEEARPQVEYYVRRAGRSSLWRLYTRFVQPILVLDNYEKGLTAVLLDSVSVAKDTLFGHSAISTSFRGLSDFRLARTETDTERLTPTTLASLADDPAKIAYLPTAARNRYRRSWEKGDDPGKHLVVYEEDLDDLRLVFSGKDRLEVLVDGAELLSRQYRFHPNAPYLIVGEECDNNAYWHYERHGDSLTFRVPLRVEVPVEEKPQVYKVNGKDVTLPPGRWYAEEEWRGTYLLTEEGL